MQLVRLVTLVLLAQMVCPEQPGLKVPLVLQVALVRLVQLDRPVLKALPEELEVQVLQDLQDL